MAIRDAYVKRKPLGDGIHRKIMQSFRTYMVVGGMPQAVSAFVDGKSYKEIDFIKRNILSLYEEDLKKYDEDNREKASGKEKKYEIDFLIVKKRKICPIEVKSSSYKSHKSFDLFTKKYPIKLEDKYIIYTKELQFGDEILYLPIYMTICL